MINKLKSYMHKFYNLKQKIKKTQVIVQTAYKLDIKLNDAFMLKLLKKNSYPLNR